MTHNLAPVQGNLTGVNCVVAYDAYNVKRLLDDQGKSILDQGADVSVDIFALSPEMHAKLLNSKSEQGGCGLAFLAYLGRT